MSLSFPAAHLVRQPSLLPLPHAIARAKRAAGSLQWTLAGESGTELTFRAGLSLWSWGEEVKIDFAGTGILIRSQCRLPTQCFDHGKNRQNCERFAVAYAA